MSTSLSVTIYFIFVHLTKTMLATVRDAELKCNAWIMDHIFTVKFLYILKYCSMSYESKDKLHTLSYEQMLRCDCGLKQYSIHSLHVD